MLDLGFVVLATIMWLGFFLASTLTIAGMLRETNPVSVGPVLFVVFSAGFLILLVPRLNAWWRFILGTGKEDPRG